MPVKYIIADELAEIIRSDQVAGVDYLVVDVRDDDFAGGNIKGCVHSPSRYFWTNVDTLVKDNKDVRTVIFHCAFSQERGPKAARVYMETRDHLENSVIKGLAQQDIFVLQDGFAQFQAKFKDDPLLVEKWDKDVWASEYF